MSLRILLVPSSALLTDHRPHGDGLVGFGFVRELAARGHRLEVACGEVDVQAALPPNVRLHRLGAGPRLGFMWRLRALHRRLAREDSLDIVHQLTPVDVGVSLALAGSPTPLVLGPYVPDWPARGPGADGEISRAVQRAKSLLRRAQQRRAGVVLLSTAAARSKLEVAENGRRSVRELPLGVDEHSWRPPEGGGAGERVLFLANLEVRKGIHVLLEAFAKVCEGHPEARLAIGGTGPELDAVRRRTESPDLAGRVELLGRVERADAPGLMGASDVYCLPSFGDPCPLSAVEAMACARPLVVTDAGGLGHLVPDGGGLKVPPGDPAALARALDRVLADRPGRLAMGRHNRRVVEERFAWERVVDRLEEVYAEALRRRKS